MAESLTLVKLRSETTDGSKPVVTPPIGLWSMRENNATWRVTVVDAAFGLEGVMDDWIGYSVSFPAQARTLGEMRSCSKARFGEFLGGPEGTHMKLDGVVSHFGDGESFLAGFKVPFAFLAPPHFWHSEMFPYWQESHPFGQVPEDALWMPVETSRGCPCSCGFCGMSHFWGSYEERPLDVLEDYFSYLATSHGVSHIIFLDDNVALRKRRFLGIVELLKRFEFSWSCPNGIYARTLADADVLKALRGSRCYALSLPFECATPRSAELMGIGKKHFTFDGADFLVNSLRALGIKTTGFFVIGYPGEEECDVLETLSFANALPLDERYIYFATPYKGTKLWDDAKPYRLDDEGTYKRPIISTPKLSRERLFEIWKEDHDRALRRIAETTTPMPEVSDAS